MRNITCIFKQNNPEFDSLEDKKALDCLFIRLSGAFTMLNFLRTFSLFWSVYKFF